MWGDSAGLVERGSVLAAPRDKRGGRLQDAARRSAVACGHP